MLGMKEKLTCKQTGNLCTCIFVYRANKEPNIPKNRSASGENHCSHLSHPIFIQL